MDPLGLDDADAMDGVIKANANQDTFLLGCRGTAHLLGMLSTHTRPLLSPEREMEHMGFSLSYEAWRELSPAAGTGLRLPHPTPPPPPNTQNAPPPFRSRKQQQQREPKGVCTPTGL